MICFTFLNSFASATKYQAVEHAGEAAAPYTSYGKLWRGGITRTEQANLRPLPHAGRIGSSATFVPFPHTAPEDLPKPMCSPHSARIRAAAKRLVTLMLLGCMLGWGSGISLPVPNFKDASTPFMCLDHACSCRDARNCWNNCCCFSQSEKLAWAARQKVTPPNYVRQKRGGDEDTSSEFCGQSDLQPDVFAALSALRSTPSKAKRAANCRGPHAPQPNAPQPSAPPACSSCDATQPATHHGLPPAGVSISNNMRCRGLANVVLIFAPVLEFDPGRGELVALNSDAISPFLSLRPDSFRAAPDPPPPRA